MDNLICILKRLLSIITTNFAASMTGYGSPVTVEGPLVEAPAQFLVTPNTGSRGLITLANFTDAQGVFTTPLITPEFHNPKSITLSAPSGNSKPIYYSQSVAVRPIDAVLNYTGLELLINNSFNSSLTPWVNEGDLQFVYLSGSAQSGGLIETVQATLTQKITGLPQGNYTLQATVSSLSADVGSAVLIVGVNDGDQMTFTGPGNLNNTFYHPGGDALIQLEFTVGGNNGEMCDCVVDSVSFKRVYVAAAQVGVSIPPGDTYILTNKDYNLSQPFYIVSEVGESGEKVIVNYGN